jgi:hypothetical protein
MHVSAQGAIEVARDLREGAQVLRSSACGGLVLCIECDGAVSTVAGAAVEERLACAARGEIQSHVTSSKRYSGQSFPTVGGSEADNF